MESKDDRVAKRIAGLSDRQRRLLRLAAAGASVAEIANRLELQPRVVESELDALMSTLGVNNRSQAAMVWWGTRAGSDPQLADSARDLLTDSSPDA